MKLQYLGDSKDSFKWDYHDYLVSELGWKHLKIVWAMTPDDGGNDGKSAPELFPARGEILKLCHDLRCARDPLLVSELPLRTGANYAVSFHDAAPEKSKSFLTGVTLASEQVVFLDPDNGFEPENSSSNKHVRYSEVGEMMKRMHSDSLITVFQHHRRKKFPDDYARICQRLPHGHATALYWHSLMFVCLAMSKDTISRVAEINRAYASIRPVQPLN